MSALTYYLCLSIIFIYNTTAYKIEKLVYNGDGFRPEAHKYLVMLLIQINDHPGLMFCSGSIIDKEWIISAAHCFPNGVTEIKIIQQFGSDINDKRVLGFSQEFATHPNFEHNPEFNLCATGSDLALVKMAEPIKFSAYTQPIGLARIRAFGQQGIIAGYGRSELGSELPVEGTVVVKSCESAPYDSRILCSRSLAYGDKGDSGGALTTEDGLVGVVSAFVPVLTGIENVYVDISVHFNWIEQVTGKKLCNTGIINV